MAMGSIILNSPEKAEYKALTGKDKPKASLTLLFVSWLEPVLANNN